MSAFKPTPLFERPTVSAQVARHLLDLIAREGLKPGDAAPSEVQICRELEVSRGSVREAYRTLAALGILAIESGRRPRLQVINAHALSQIFGYALETSQVSPLDVLETRRTLEVQAVQLAARHASKAQRLRLAAEMRLMRSALDALDRPKLVASDMTIHTVLAEASLNPLNPLLLNALRASLEHQMNLNMGARRSAKDLVRIVDAHGMIVERVCAGDAAGAAAAMSRHFDLSAAAMSELMPDVKITRGRSRVVAK